MDATVGSNGTVTPSLRLNVASPRCVADDFGGEIVALNLDTGFYFSLRDLGAAIWRDLVSGHPVGDVVAALGGPEELLGAEAVRFIDRLVTAGLLEPAGDGTSPQALPTAAAFIGSSTAAIAIDTYDDMRDLVMADPIHDVDEEVGWPVRREGT